MMHSSPIIIAVLTLIPSLSSAASIPKLYDVEYGPGFISPLDVGKHGGSGFAYGRELRVSALPAEKGATVTRYEIQEIASDANVQVAGQNFQWSTVLTGPVTRTYTMDQGASTLHVSIPPSVITPVAMPLRIVGVVRDCSLDLDKKEGVCVEEVQLPLITTITAPATTETSTYTSTRTETYTRALAELKITNGALSHLAPLLSCAMVSLSVAVGVFLA